MTPTQADTKPFSIDEVVEIPRGGTVRFVVKQEPNPRGRLARLFRRPQQWRYDVVAGIRYVGLWPLIPEQPTAHLDVDAAGWIPYMVISAPEGSDITFPMLQGVHARVVGLTENAIRLQFRNGKSGDREAAGKPIYCASSKMVYG